MRDKKVLFLTQAAAIAAVYVVLTYVFAPFSFGPVQVRISEALTILPFFTPAAVPGLAVGCVIANIMVGGIVVDIVFGSIATFIGAVISYMIAWECTDGPALTAWLRPDASVVRRTSGLTKFMVPVSPIVANTIIVPFVLKYGYGEALPIPFMMLTVGAGEIISCGVIGLILLFALDRYKDAIFRTETA